MSHSKRRGQRTARSRGMLIQTRLQELRSKPRVAMTWRRSNGALRLLKDLKTRSIEGFGMFYFNK